jgi:hypothetical protein
MGPARARIVETAQVRPGDLEINPYPTPRRVGPARGGHRGRRYGPKVAGPILNGTRVGSSYRTRLPSVWLWAAGLGVRGDGVSMPHPRVYCLPLVGTIPELKPAILG